MLYNIYQVTYPSKCWADVRITLGLMMAPVPEMKSASSTISTYSYIN